LIPFQFIYGTIVSYTGAVYWHEIEIQIFQKNRTGLNLIGRTNM